jgi:hypothetical protein
MSKFIIVDEAPENLNDGEVVIKMPDFVEELKTSEKFASKLGSQKITSLYHLKTIMTTIGQKYDPENFNPISAIPYSLYEGLPYENNGDLSKIVLRILNKHYPQMITQFLDHSIKNRKENTKTVYFVGPENYADPFIKNGLDRVDSGVAKKITSKDADNANTVV